MADEAEVLVNAEGRVGIVIEAMSAAPVSYKLLDHESMTLELVCDDGSRRPIAFPVDARDGWQKVVDNEELLVTEVSAGTVDTFLEVVAKAETEEELQEAGIVRDEWLKPEVVV
jgi:hypothetical protein